MAEYIHGGDIYSREIEHDFSANINPLGMPESAVDALVSSVSAFEVYPDINCTKLVKAIAQYEVVSEKNILCSNGAADLIYRLSYALKPKKALLTAPSFSEYALALKKVDCEIEYETLFEENGFEVTESVLEKIPEADIFFLCSPNNPVGNTVKPELLEKIVKQCKKLGTQLVVDECFMDFVTDSEKYSAKKYLDYGIIILKAFTKIFAMAGLRLGYMLCSDAKIIDRVRECGSCWSVSTAAQIAGTAALSEKGYIEKTRAYMAAEREYLIRELKKLGFKVFTSEANFIFFKSQTDIEKPLLERKIAVRNCENYVGLSRGFYRIAVRKHEENQLLINTIERILQNG